jgi:anti-sigma B factor antagonist
MDALNRESAASVKVSEPGQGRIEVALYGELDLQSAPLIERRLEQLSSEHHTEIVFELAGLQFIDSSGLSVLLRCAQSATRVSVRHPSPIVERVIVATGLESVLPIEEAPWSAGA